MNVSSTSRPVSSLNSSLTLATSSKVSLFSSAVNRMARLTALDAASHSGLGICTRAARHGFRVSMWSASGMIPDLNNSNVGPSFRRRGAIHERFGHIV